MPGILSSRPNWDPQPLNPQVSVSLPLWFQGGDTLAGEGVGGVTPYEGTETVVL